MQDKAAADEQQRAAANDMKNSILSQVLTQAARARCKYEIRIFKPIVSWSVIEIQSLNLVVVSVNTLLIGKPEKGRMVENLILQMAQTQQIMSKLNEEELIGLLEKVNQQFDNRKKTTVKVIHFCFPRLLFSLFV